MSQLRFTIRPLRSSDASDIYELMHMPNVLYGTSLLPSTTIDVWQKTIQGWVEDERMHVFVAEVQGKAVGITSVHVGVGRESHVGDIAMAVHDKHQRQGIGRMLMMAITDLADNWLNLLRLELDVYADNDVAIHLYQQFDFEIEGRKRLDAFRGGRYIDSYIMARLRPQVQTNYAETLTKVPESPVPPVSPIPQESGSGSGPGTNGETAK